MPCKKVAPKMFNTKTDRKKEKESRTMKRNEEGPIRWQQKQQKVEKPTKKWNMYFYFCT
jgi:hypothetical protein